VYQGGDAMANLKLRIEFNKGKPGVDLDKLEHVIESMRRFLASLGEDIELLDPTAWIGIDFKNGSLGFVTEYPRVVDGGKLTRFNDAVLAVARSEYPASLRQQTANQFFNLASVFDIGETADMAVFSESGAEIQFEISRKTVTDAQSLKLLPFRETLGSVQGTIHSWFREAKNPYFVLRELSSRDLINCHYEPDDYPAIYKAMEIRDQVVHVRGTILTDTRKHEIKHVRVKDMILAEPFGYEDVEKFLKTSRAQ
jgi:hypothetical protein